MTTNLHDDFPEPARKVARLEEPVSYPSDAASPSRKNALMPSGNFRRSPRFSLTHHSILWSLRPLFADGNQAAEHDSITEMGGLAVEM